MASELRLLPDRLVERAAAFDISSTLDLHDPRFGNAGNNDAPCPTCGMRCDVCMGHHALLSLGMHMFHPLMYKESQKLINSTCLSCNKRLFKASKARARMCPECSTVNHGDYVIYANDMRVAVRAGDPEHRIHAHSVPEGLLPDGYITSNVLVPPIYLRTPEGIEWPTEIQRLYEQLVAAVRTQTNVCVTYCKTIGALRKEGITGIMSGKGGVFRQLMMGKRVELSARAVIVGDPSLALDQVAVPKAVADLVKIRVSCTKYNEGRLKSMASSKLLLWEGTNDTVEPANVLQGMSFQRPLEDGDLTMLNRQPSLSRVSLMCFRVVIRSDSERVFAINPQITPPFNADFDGDEMNIFFMSDKAEMMELCSVYECARPLLPVQDVVTGCYLMSEKDAPVSDSVWGDCMTYANGWHTPKRRTTFGLLSMCIRGYDGSRLYKSSFRHLQHVDIHLLQQVVERWMSARGLTVSLRSLVARPVTRGSNETTDAFKERCVLRVREDMSGTGIMSMIDSGAKGSAVHASHMAVAIGQQYIGGKEGVFCEMPYSRGLKPEEFFGHQMAAREGVVSTGISTASTGYLNRRACKTIADLKFQYNGTVADQDQVSSFRM